LTVYTDGFRAYEPLEEDDTFTSDYVIHGNGEYVDEEVHVNSCETHGSLVRSMTLAQSKYLKTQTHSIPQSVSV